MFPPFFFKSCIIVIPLPLISTAGSLHLAARMDTCVSLGENIHMNTCLWPQIQSGVICLGFFFMNLPGCILWKLYFEKDTQH